VSVNENAEWRSCGGCRAGERVPSNDARMCWFTRGAELRCHDRPREYQEGEPMPVVVGELAADDMCNMFGYFITQAGAASLP
jgi:hypothetical protein